MPISRVCTLYIACVEVHAWCENQMKQLMIEGFACFRNTAHCAASNSSYTIVSLHDMCRAI